jgi:mRNA interferase YafQ
MYLIIPTKDFKESLKKIQASGTFKKSAQENLAEAINLLSTGKKLPEKYSDHQLAGELKEYRECHVKGDILLIYQINATDLVLLLVNIGSHSYLNL